QLQAVTDEWNKHRSSIVDLLSFWHTSSGLALSQGESTSSFEEATEYGEPQGIRPPSQYALLGFTFKDHDLATRFTWKALRDMDARQVRAFHNEALVAENKLTTGSILRRLFDPAEYPTPEGLTSFGLWNGEGDMVPPPYKGKTFSADHSHYIGTDSNAIDS